MCLTKRKAENLLRLTLRKPDALDAASPQRPQVREARGPSTTPASSAPHPARPARTKEVTPRFLVTEPDTYTHTLATPPCHRPREKPPDAPSLRAPRQNSHPAGRRVRGALSRKSGRFGRQAGCCDPSPRRVGVPRAPSQAGAPREAGERPQSLPPADHVGQSSGGSPRLSCRPTAAEQPRSAARTQRLPSSAPALQLQSLPFKPTPPRVFRTGQWPATGRGRAILWSLPPPSRSWDVWNRTHDEDQGRPEGLLLQLKTSISGTREQERSGCTYTDEEGFSEDTTMPQENLPYDGAIPQIKIRNDYNFTKNDILNVSHQIILAVDDPQEKATHNKACRNVDMAVILDKITENAVNKKHDREKQCTIILHIPPSKESTSKSNISDILLNHLSKEEFIKGQGIDCETLPEISNADSFDEPIIKNIILCYFKNSWPKEQIPELDDQLNPRRGGEDSSKPSFSPITKEENISDLEEPVVAGHSSLQGNSNFLTKTKSPDDKQKRFQGQSPQKQQTEKSSSWSGFKYGQGQVHYQLPDFSKIAPKVKIPKNNVINKPLTVSRQVRSSPDLRDESALVQDLLETMPRSNCVEKQHQEQKKTVEISRQIQMEPASHIHQELLTGIESKTSLFKLSSTSQEDSSSSSYIFQNISKGKKMCQKLKEQTDQLKAKVQDFSKRITQDSPYLQRRLVLGKLQGHLELLEQEFLATKEKHLTLQQGHKHKSPALDDFDPERKVEGEIFKLEMLLEDVKEKVDEHKYTSPPSLPVSSPIILDHLVSVSSLPSNEIPKELPGHPSEPPGTRGSKATGVTRAGPQEALSEELCELDPQTYLNWPSGAAAAEDLPDQMSIRLSSVSREDPNNTVGGQEHSETTVPSPRCAFCHWALERKQKMEKRGHRRISCGRFSIVIQENPLHLCSACSSDAGDSFYSDSGMGLQSNKCENCGAKISNSQRVSGKELPKEFHYRHNTPGQNYLSYSERGFVQLHSLDEKKNSSPCYVHLLHDHNSVSSLVSQTSGDPHCFHLGRPCPPHLLLRTPALTWTLPHPALHLDGKRLGSCSKRKMICSQTANFKFPQDKHEPMPEKKDLTAFMTRSSDLTTPSPHSHSRRIYASKSLCDFRSHSQMLPHTCMRCSPWVPCLSPLDPLQWPLKSFPSLSHKSLPPQHGKAQQVLNSALDHALRTATVLKETTDQMIKAITEDLAEARRWRNRLKY
ncbi:LOW QUALITY PROTEIN: protein AKNAD1 [Dugong dugon]